MSVYSFQAKDISGKVLKGEREAISEADLLLELQGYGYYVYRIQDAKAKRSRRVLKSNYLADFCQELSTMLLAGIPIVKALGIMSSSRSTSRRLGAVYTGISSLISRGVPLSEAMNQQNGAFPELLINVIYSSEISGTMGDVTKRMAAYYKREYIRERKVSSTLAYPKLLVVITLIMVIALFTFVLPSVMNADMFSGQELPLITKIMIGISNFFVKGWVFIIAACVAVYVAASQMNKQPAVKLFYDKMLLSIPKIGSVFKTLYTARFSITLGYLYSSGVQLVTAISVAAGTVGNLYLYNQLLTAINNVKQGEMLSTSIQNVQGLNPKLFHIISIGEETGKLDEVLAAMAETFEQEVDTDISKLISYISPFIIIIMSLVVGVVVLSVMLPIFQMYTAIE